MLAAETNESKPSSQIRLLQPREKQEADRTEEEEEEVIFCRKSTGNPIDDVQLAENTSSSSSSNGLLLSLTLAGVGIDFCSDDEAFPFQHFQYLSSPETEIDTIGWHVNCCDSLQELGHQYLYLSPGDTLAPSEAFNGPASGITDPPTYITHSHTYTPYDPTADDQIDYFPFAVGQVFVSSVSAFLSLTIILAITFPILKKKQRDKASTYNLYLAFSACPDLIYNLFLVYLFSTYQSSGWITVLHIGEVPWMEHPFDLTMFAACAAANLYINAIIAFEIRNLMRNCKRCKRCRAPTLTKVCLQAFGAYTIATIIFLIDYLVFAVDYFGDEVELEDILPPLILSLMYLPLAIFLPVSILIVICFQIYCEGLVSGFSGEAGERLTVLFRYFSRIIGFYFFWLPSVVFYAAEEKEGFYNYLPGMIYAIGSWVNFALCLTKPDVRKNVLDLFSGKVFRPDSKKKRETNETNRFIVGGSNDIKYATGTQKSSKTTADERVGANPPDESPDFEHLATTNMHSGGIDDVDTNCNEEEEEEEEYNSNIFDFREAADPITDHDGNH